jgi:hypothetical protein
VHHQSGPFGMTVAYHIARKNGELDGYHDLFYENYYL